MTDKQLSDIWADAQTAPDPDAFASDWALSSAALDPEDPDQEIDLERFEQLRTLWHVAHDPFRDLLRRLGLRQIDCATRFCIPIRSVQDWTGERRTPPPYLRLMMAEAVGLVRLRG
jgi:hypothetical protein